MSTCKRRVVGARKQRGMAMLVAILLVALGTIIAAAVAYESAMSARRGIATFSFDEALLIGQGAEAFAAYGLREVVRQDTSQVKTTFPDQAWGQPLGPIEVAPGVMLVAQLEDLQGRFNLNSLIQSSGKDAGKPDPQAVAAFQQLLGMLNMEPKWADLLIDWIDSDSQVTGEGAEDSVYLGQNPPYLTANQFITSTTELLALPGFGRERYVRLAPFVAALPPNTPINICSASGYVLDAYRQGNQDYSRDPDALQKQRASAGRCLPTLEEYRNAFNSADASAFTKVQAKFDVNSGYFRLSSVVTIGTTEFNLYSLLYRDQQLQVHTLARAFSPD